MTVVLWKGIQAQQYWSRLTPDAWLGWVVSRENHIDKCATGGWCVYWSEDGVKRPKLHHPSESSWPADDSTCSLTGIREAEIFLSGVSGLSSRTKSPRFKWIGYSTVHKTNHLLCWTTCIVFIYYSCESVYHFRGMNKLNSICVRVYIIDWHGSVE